MVYPEEFDCIGKAREILEDRLACDDSFPDMHDQLSFRPGTNGCHKYFLNSNISLLESMMEHVEFIPLPSSLKQLRLRAKCASFMGIIPEISRAWITIDNIIYFWNYLEPSDVDVFDGSKEVIISVAVSVPKSDVFSESVKYVVVIATSVDVSIVAICVEASNRIKLVPTTFILPADNISMLKISGSQVGRLFMIGNDHCLYEFDYSFSNDAWSVLSGSEPKHSCKKINIFSWNWHLNDFMRPFVSNFFSTDGLVDVTVDNARNIVYCITSNAMMSAVYLGEFGKESILLAHNFDVMSATKHFLASPRAPPESSPKVIRFGEVTSSEFNVINICPISLVESKKVHIMVALANGIRIYMSFVTPNGVASEFTQNNPFEPVYIEICGVRSPPPLDMLQKITSRDVENAEPHCGYFPTYNQSQPLSFSTMFYSKGVCMLSKDGNPTNDELVCFYEDLSLRGNVCNHHFDYACMKEVVSLVIDNNYCGNKVYDVKEDVSVLSDPQFAQIFNLFVRSLATDELKSSEKGKLSLDPPVYYSNFMSNHEKGQNSVSDVATLGELCLQHIPTQCVLSQRQFLVLTEQGLSVVKKLRPCDILYQILSQNIYHSDVLQQFIGAFGEYATMTMCVGLAVGLPYDAGGTKLTGLFKVSSNTKDSISNASKVVRVRAMEVLLKISSPFSQPSPLVTKLPLSYHCNALFTVFGRIVRPIWRRVIILDEDIFTLSCDVLVNTQLRILLTSFKDMLLNFFSSIIMNDKEPYESIAFVPDVADSITSHILDGSKRIKGGDSIFETSKEFDSMCIKSLYFLTSRTVQTLALLELYNEVQKRTNSLSSAQFKNVTFCDLVICRSTLDNIRQFNGELFQLVVSLSDRSFCEHIRKELLLNCYYFFTPRDYLIFTARENFYLWKQPSQRIENGDLYIKDCINAYYGASSFWDCGEFLLKENSEFMLACKDLILLSELGVKALVDVCFNVANHFLSDELKININPQDFSAKVELHWDCDKFQSYQVVTDEIRNACVKRCYETLCATILSLINESMNLPLFPSGVPKSNIILSTIDRIVKQSRDAELHRALFKILDDHKQVELLVQISSPVLEQFLKIHNPKLLYTYYRTTTGSREADYIKASEVMCELATTPIKVPIEHRILYLQQALSSIRDAGCNSASKEVSFFEREREIECAVQIAELQMDIVQRLQHCIEQDWLEKLKYSFVDITSLFHDFCMPHNLWDACIIIMRISHEENFDIINKLWTLWIISLSARKTKIPQIEVLLQQETEEYFQISQQRKMSVENDSFFETKQWFGKTLMAIERLGKKLGVDNSMSDYFPLRSIVLKLEQYLSYLTMLPNIEVQENKLQLIGMFENLRIPFSSVVEIYFAILIDARKDSAVLQLQLLWTIVLSIRHWLESCLRNRQHDVICVSKVKNGEVKLWLDNAGKYVAILTVQLYESHLHDISSIVLAEMESCKMSVCEILASRQ